MQRIYYQGKKRSDPRLAGVELSYGCAIDMPEALAAKLLREKAFCESPPEPESEEVELDIPFDDIGGAEDVDTSIE